MNRRWNDGDSRRCGDEGGFCREMPLCEQLDGLVDAGDSYWDLAALMLDLSDWDG